MGRFMSPDPDGAGSLEQDLQMNWNGGAADNGNVGSWSAAGQQNFNRTYSYDSLNRLAAMSDSNTSQQCRGLSWTYDAWGNRTDQTQTAGTCNSFHQSVNTKNQLVDTINNTLQYDAAGNMTYDGNHSYTYDAENRLIQVDGGSTASYVYDAVGHRVTKTVSGAWRDYLYDTSGNVVAETTSGGWNVGYAYLGGQLLAQYSNSTTYFVHQDHLGSTRLRTTLSQSVYDSFDYLPFGELLSGAGDYVHKFTGDERDDETGLDHTWFRQYSSSLGRWMHPDPAGLAAVDPSNPQSWNRYAYVLNNPLAFVDPLGLDTCYLDYSSITVNAVAELLSGGGGGMGPMSPCAGFVSRLCGPIPPSPNGFTLGVRQKSQTWKQCMEANKNTYSLGGAVELTVNVATGTNSNISESTSVITGNGITDTLFGDPTEIAKESCFLAAEKGAGTTLTWGRRTSDIMALNLAGKGGLPKALASSGAKGLLKSVGKALHAGLDEAEKLAVDLGLAGAEAIGCSIPAGNVLP